MSIELSLTIACKECGKRSWASEEDHGGGLTFGVCDRCKELRPMLSGDADEPPPAPCPCGGTCTEWDHQTCPHCGAKVKGEWFQTWN
jgi:hypothetical protein